MIRSLLTSLTCVLLIPCAVATAAQEPTKHAEPAKLLEAVDGQWRITGSAYSAIVPPSGLMNFLSLGGKALMTDAVTVNLLKERWNTPSQHACASITQPTPESLACEGDTAAITYTFGKDSIGFAITAKKEPIQFFITMSKDVEGVQTRSNEARWGESVAVAGKRSYSYGLNEVKLSAGGQILSITGMPMLYNPRDGRGSVIMRMEVPAGKTLKVQFQARPENAEDRALFVIPAVYSQPLTLLSPVNWQVFQRQTPTGGVIRVAGKVKVPCDTVEFRRKDQKWQSVALDAQTGNFNAQIPAPAGGWHRCELRALKDGKEVAHKSIENVGIGEVFVIAGQSNSTNCGEEQQRSNSGMVSSFSGTEWRLADDPQPGTHDGSNKGSPWPAFGDALAAKLKVPIAIASTGHGASNVAEWQPGGELFNWTMARILQFGPQGFRMVLWHQGESDGATPELEYYERLREIIEQTNVRAGWSFPWMVAQVGAAKKRLWAEGVALEGPNTDVLRGDYRGMGGKDVHFSAKGLQKHGELWAEKVAKSLENQ